MGWTERIKAARVIKWRVRPNWGCARRLDGLQGFPAKENPHRQFMKVLLTDLKRGVHAKNGFPVLNALDAARGKTLAIVYSIDMEYHGLIHSSGRKSAHEGVTHPVLFHGLCRADNA